MKKVLLPISIVCVGNRFCPQTQKDLLVTFQIKGSPELIQTPEERVSVSKVVHWEASWNTLGSAVQPSGIIFHS